MSDLVRNPEDRFSRVAAQIINNVLSSTDYCVKVSSNSETMCAVMFCITKTCPYDVHR